MSELDQQEYAHQEAPRGAPLSYIHILNSLNRYEQCSEFKL